MIDLRVTLPRSKRCVGAEDHVVLTRKMFSPFLADHAAVVEQDRLVVAARRGVLVRSSSVLARP
jgi:hypothetical protein